MTGAAENKVVELVFKEKLCPKCRITKPAFEFYRRSGNKSLLTSHCKECVKSKQRKDGAKYSLNPLLSKERRERHLAKIKKDPVRYAKKLENKNKWNRSDKYFNMYFKNKFGVTFEFISSLLSKQNGLCSNIGCNKEIAIIPSDDKIKAVVDHCHTTGDVRSLMCVRCNALLGHIENNAGVVRGLIDYLNKYKNNNNK